MDKFDAAKFQDFIIYDEFEIKGNEVFFSLVFPKHDHIYVAAQVSGTEKTDKTVWNFTQDPQNEIDVDFDLIQVEENTVCFVHGFDCVHAIEGMPFHLTQSQTIQLNELLKSHFEELKHKELAA